MRYVMRQCKIALLVALLVFAAAGGVKIAAYAVDISRSDVWSETDASNTSSTEPGFPEGMAPSRVNDAARAVMGAMRRWFVQSQPTVAATGSAGTYNLTWSVQPSTVANGQIFGFWANHTNAGAATGNVHGLVTRAIVKASTAGLVTLAATDISANTFHLVAATGSQLQLLNPHRVYEEGGWLPSLSGSSVAGTQTYTTRSGRYTRMGNVVTVAADIAVSATDAATAGAMRVEGLPYTSGAPGAVAPGTFNGISWAANFTQLALFIPSGATRISLNPVGSNQTGTTVGPEQIGPTFRLTFSGSYIAQ